KIIARSPCRQGVHGRAITAFSRASPTRPKLKPYRPCRIGLRPWVGDYAVLDTIASRVRWLARQASVLSPAHIFGRHSSKWGFAFLVCAVISIVNCRAEGQFIWPARIAASEPPVTEFRAMSRRSLKSIIIFSPPPNIQFLRFGYDGFYFFHSEGQRYGINE